MRVVLVVQVRLVQVPKRLELHLGVLEEAQLHQQRQPHEPQLRTRGGMAGHRGRRGRGSRSLLAGGAPGFGPAGAELTSPSRTPCPAAPRLTKLSDQSASAEPGAGHSESRRALRPRRRMHAPRGGVRMKWGAGVGGEEKAGAAGGWPGSDGAPGGAGAFLPPLCAAGGGPVTGGRWQPTRRQRELHSLSRRARRAALCSEG